MMGTVTSTVPEAEPGRTLPYIARRRRDPSGTWEVWGVEEMDAMQNELGHHVFSQPDAVRFAAELNAGTIWGQPWRRGINPSISDLAQSSSGPSVLVVIHT